MAHSLNNAKAAQFKKRVASYSTHGSRRGFVDIDIPIPSDQLNDAKESYRSLCQAQQSLSEEIKAGRDEFGFAPHVRLGDVLSGKGENYGRWRKNKWPKARLERFEKIREKAQELERIKNEISHLRKRLQISAEEPDEKQIEIKTNGKKLKFHIHKWEYVRLKLFEQICRSEFGSEFTKAVNRDVDKILDQVVQENQKKNPNQ